MIKSIAFTGYPTKNMKRAREFFEGLLGLVPSDEFGPVTDETKYIEYNIGEGTLMVGEMDTWLPSKDGPNIAFEVDNLPELIEQIRTFGSEVVMEQMDFPKCSMALVRDADGNLLTLHQKKA